MRTGGPGHWLPPPSVTGPGTLQVLGREGDVSSPHKELTVLLWKQQPSSRESGFIGECQFTGV